MTPDQLTDMQTYCESLLADEGRCTCGGGVAGMHEEGCGIPRHDEVLGLAEFVLELLDAHASLRESHKDLAHQLAAALEREAAE